METPRDNSIGAQMSIASTLLKRKMHAKIHGLKRNVTMEQLSVLEMLKFHGPQTMTDLARMTSKENAVITRMVDILEKNGFVKRKNKSGDRRAYIIHLTESGKNEFETIIPHVISELTEATSILTEEECNECLRIIKKIIKHNIT